MTPLPQNIKQEVQKTKKLPAKILSYEERIGKYQKHHLTDELISRANKPENATKRTSVISKTTRSVVAIARQKLRGSLNEWFMSDIYMSKVTGCQRRQNSDIIKQLHGTKFDITRCRKRKGWVLKKLEFEVISWQNIAKSENATNPNNKKDTEDNCRHENNSSKRTRSNARAHESKFPNNSNSSNKQTAEIETTEGKKSKTESTEIKVLVSKKKLLANKRKKTTNSERVTRYQKFKAYDNPKNLSQHYPLSQEDCYELQKRSGKAYNLNAMNEILLDMSRKPELQGHSFVSKAKFMCYMTKAYREEGRDVDKANSPTFKIIKRRPQAEIEEIVTLNQREKYLNQVENSGIHARCDYTQFRARIAGQFPIHLAYALLINMIDIKREENVLKMTIHKPVPLSDHYEQLLLNHAKSVGGYAGVNELEFVGIASNSNIPSDLGECFHKEPRSDLTYPKKQASLSASKPVYIPSASQLQLPEGIWGKVCSLFISQQEGGEALYKHWLAPLSVVEKDGIIELSTTSDMVRDRIEQTYLPFLNKVAGKFGINRIGLN